MISDFGQKKNLQVQSHRKAV